MFKEIFTSIILGMFYPDGSWLNELTNFDHLVSYNNIHLSEVGNPPNVIVNNATWPLTPNQRWDSGQSHQLETFDTEPTHVTNVEEMETNYDKAQSVLRQHADELRKLASITAAYNISPTANGPLSPVLRTTGADRGDGTKALTYRDITELSLAFDQQDIMRDGRILVMDPKHKADLKNEDMKLYKIMMTDHEIDGFKLYTFTGNPHYDPATGYKLPMGSLTGNTSSMAFAKSEVFRAMGDINGDIERNWAEYRGWLIGVQMRFLANTLRGMGTASVFSANV